MASGWTCTVVNAESAIQLEQLDAAGDEWFADGPEGDAIGSLDDVLRAVTACDADPAWITVVRDTIESDHGSTNRSMLLVKRVTGRWFHATFTENRASIRRHGLDHRRMSGPGIAGSRTPEAAGGFLSCDIESARWFARRRSTRSKRCRRTDGVRGAPHPGAVARHRWKRCRKPPCRYPSCPKQRSDRGP